MRPLTQLVAQAGERSIAVLSVILDDPAGYGRVLRDVPLAMWCGSWRERRHCKERGIREVNTGLTGRTGTALASLARVALVMTTRSPSTTSPMSSSRQ